MAQIFGESVEALLPECAVMGDPVGCGRERLRIETAVVDPPLAPALQETGLFENLEVLRDRGQRHVERLRQIGDACLSESQPREDSAAGRVRERGERPVERAGIVNH